MTDLKPLSDLKVKVEKKSPKPSLGADVSCFFTLRTASGREASLFVEVSTLQSVDDAKSKGRAIKRVTAMKHEGMLGGLGAEADAFSKEEEKKTYQQAEYIIAARYENRVVEVWLSVLGKPLIPKTSLAEKVRAVVEATAELASTYKPDELPQPTK